MSVFTLLDNPRFWLLLNLSSAILLRLLGGTLSYRVKQTANLTRWLLIPYLGLLAGGLSPRLLGLTNLDWQASLSLGVAIVVAVLSGLVLVRLVTTQPALSPRTNPPAITSPLASIFYSGAEELHWCFLRGALWEIFLALSVTPEQAAYQAIGAAALYTALELLLGKASVTHKLLKTVVLVATSVLFFYTHNFWLGWLLHSLSWLILA
jgi:hypothetical protein